MGRTEADKRSAFDKLTDEILEELLKEEAEEEIRRQEIIKNGCPCKNKVRKTYSLSKIDYLECDICHKQFSMDGNPK